MDEQTIWEGRSETVAADMTGGRAGGRYRLSTHYLYFESGMLATERQQVPVHLVHDVDVTRSLWQKTRSLGDVVVHVARPGGWETVVLESVSDPDIVQQHINVAAHEARLREQRAANTVAYQGSPMPAPQQTAPAAGENDVMSQLERLGRLRDAGIVTEEEFAAKKAELLGRL